ncbi:MAG: diguanylate cyclase [Elusimicrobia bacterium]|nr:diguanylate cyclase [Candidatus Obscuribacterium magneticum]
MTTQQKVKPKILVVEDDAAVSNMLEKILLEEGYEVAVADNGKVAEEKLADISPDLVLLDLHVPERSGFDILKEIRRRDQDFGIFVPVIILTGVYTSRNDKVDCLNIGADDFLPKPFDLVELLARVRSLVRLRDLYKRTQFLATHDHLTSCYNRRYVMDFLDREMARYKRYATPFSFVLIDLDHFKQINDQFGHEGGDQMLIHLGFRLQDFFRAVDCVARLGGDEFAIVLPDCNRDNAEKVGERLIKDIQDPKRMEGLPPHLAERLSVSIGMACLPEHTGDRDELIRLADEAMYEAKKAGRNQFILAHPKEKSN